MNATALLAADEVQAMQLELAACARADALARAEAAMRREVRRLDKAATERLLRATAGRLVK